MKRWTVYKEFLLLVVFCLSFSLQTVAQNPTQKPVNEVVSLDPSKIKGIWWPADDPDAPTAQFWIRDSTIYYPDNIPPEYPYAIRHDTLIIFFNDGFISESKITKATGDTLQLDGGALYIKSIR